MPPDLTSVFSVLKPILEKLTDRCAVTTDTRAEYTLVTRLPSPFKQHKRHPLEFASVRLGKTYVSFHLMPVYMSPI